MNKYIVFLFYLVLAGCVNLVNAKECANPPLPKENLVDIFAKRMAIKGRWSYVGLDQRKMETSLTIREDGCNYTISLDKPIETWGKEEQATVKADRMGNVIYEYFVSHRLSKEEKTCDDPPLSGEQLIDIYAGEISRRSATKAEDIKIGKTYFISEDDHDKCNYVVFSSGILYGSAGPYVKINRKRKVLEYMLG